MKTTIDLPDELLIAAKIKAAETRTTLREVFERGLRRELRRPGGQQRGSRRRRRIRWVTAPGGLPPGLDVASREKMHDWLQTQR
jgi:Arc/MetJ family transcription regulator